MQVLQVRMADALEDEVLGQALLEDRVSADNVEMRQVSGHSGQAFKGRFRSLPSAEARRACWASSASRSR